MIVAAGSAIIFIRIKFYINSQDSVLTALVKIKTVMVMLA